MIALNRVDLMAFFKYFPMTPIVLHYRIKCIPGGGAGVLCIVWPQIYQEW